MSGIKKLIKYTSPGIFLEFLILQCSEESRGKNRSWYHSQDLGLGIIKES
jgi:hypothetical protein